ncbi:MAG: hypothetical protein ACRDSR_02320 [Pseudonocardiaceae bacterium]
MWAGRNSRDLVGTLGNHGAIHPELLGGAGLGDDPAEDGFGANRFQAEPTTRKTWRTARSPQLSPEQADKQMAQYRETVRGATKEVARALAEAVDGEVKGAVGHSTLCTDDGAGWAYDVTGRVDPPADALLLFRVSSPCLIIPEEQCDSYPRDEPSPDVVPIRK